MHTYTCLPSCHRDEVAAISMHQLICSGNGVRPEARMAVHKSNAVCPSWTNIRVSVELKILNTEQIVGCVMRTEVTKVPITG